MKKNRCPSFGSMLAVFVLAGVFLTAAPAAARHFHHRFPYNPVIFVHGGAGSGAQFESQAMRFESNGYPHGYINVLEYDSSQFPMNNPAAWPAVMGPIWQRLDQLIADLQKKYGVEKVDLLGHSLGTAVCQYYLASTERAANVAHYVNIDGGEAAALPGGVPTLALWADMTAPGGAREIGGAWNVTLDKTTHIQAATSAKAFFYMYKFFTHKHPQTTDILPEGPGRIEVAGRAVYFPQNTGAAGSTLKVYEVNGCTGEPLGRRPAAVYAIGEDGDWGPFKARAGQHYAFVLVHPTGEIHPFYLQPFIRSDYLVRLNTSPEPGGGISGEMDRSEDHTNLVISRNMEFWGDQGVDNDILAINGVNVVNAATCPSQPFPSIVSAMFVFDQGNDTVSHPEAPISEFAALTFFTGIDLYIPGAYPPDGTVRLTLIPRGGNGLMQVINIPNWASSEVRRISVQFNDFIQADDVPFCAWESH